MAQVAGYTGVLAGCALTVLLLTRARWTWRAPRVAIVSWQALGLSLGVALIGLPLAFGLAPYGLPTAHAVAAFAGDLVRGDVLAAMGPLQVAAVVAGLLIAGRLLWVTVACLLRAVRSQRRHRRMLAFVGRPDPAVPGALVLDHPLAAAYCLPGLRPTVVVSAGTLKLLAGGELAAVLSHEQAHAAERHDLVLLPFTALREALRPARWLRAASDAVGLLVEMRADDRARRRHSDAPLVAALRRFAAAPAAGTPAGALGMAGAQGPGCRAATCGAAVALGVADRAVQARIQRLDDRRGPPRLPAAATLLLCAGLVSAPLVLLLA